MPNKKMIILIAIAIILKGALFFYAQSNAPQMKMQADSHSYLDSSVNFFPHGMFAKTGESGSLNPEFYRTPGYPLFLGVFNDLLKIPLGGIILLQILLTIASALIVYKAANKIDPRLGTCALIIILFDPAITVYSLMILTESLYLFLISIFTLLMINYIQGRSLKDLFCAALILSAATYVRPVSIYLCSILVAFVLLPKLNKKSITHGLLFLVTAYSLLLGWQWRNYHHFQKFQFSNIENATVHKEGLYKSFQRNEDPYSQGLSAPIYYLNVTSRNILSLLTRPASLKYFGSDTLKKAGKVISYPWIAFWLVGFLYGVSKIKNNPSLLLCLVATVYFMGATIVGAMWGSGPRFRVPIMPFIAIISAYGWNLIYKR